MTHFMMIVLHIVALFFFFPALFATIPLHIIVAKMDGKGGGKGAACWLFAACWGAYAFHLGISPAGYLAKGMLATPAAAYERAMTDTEKAEAHACTKFAYEQGWTVKKVSLCNRNLFSPNVYLIEAFTDGTRNNTLTLKQCKVGGGYVRILGALQQWEC